MHPHGRPEGPWRAVWLAAATVLCAVPAGVFLVRGELAGLLVLTVVLTVTSPLALRCNQAAFRAACIVGALVTLFAMFFGLVF